MNVCDAGRSVDKGAMRRVASKATDVVDSSPVFRFNAPCQDRLTGRLAVAVQPPVSCGLSADSTCTPRNAAAVGCSPRCLVPLCLALELEGECGSILQAQNILIALSVRK